MIGIIKKNKLLNIFIISLLMICFLGNTFAIAGIMEITVSSSNTAYIAANGVFIDNDTYAYPIPYQSGVVQRQITMESLLDYDQYVRIKLDMYYTSVTESKLTSVSTDNVNIIPYLGDFYYDIENSYIYYNSTIMLEEVIIISAVEFIDLSDDYGDTSGYKLVIDTTQIDASTTMFEDAPATWKNIITDSTDYEVDESDDVEVIILCESIDYSIGDSKRAPVYIRNNTNEAVAIKVTFYPEWISNVDPTFAYYINNTKMIINDEFTDYDATYFNANRDYVYLERYLQPYETIEFLYAVEYINWTYKYTEEDYNSADLYITDIAVQSYTAAEFDNIVDEYKPTLSTDIDSDYYLYNYSQNQRVQYTSDSASETIYAPVVINNYTSESDSIGGQTYMATVTATWYAWYEAAFTSVAGEDIEAEEGSRFFTAPAYVLSYDYNSSAWTQNTTAGTFTLNSGVSQYNNVVLFENLTVQVPIAMDEWESYIEANGEDNNLSMSSYYTEKYILIIDVVLSIENTVASINNYTGFIATNSLCPTLVSSGASENFSIAVRNPTSNVVDVTFTYAFYEGVTGISNLSLTNLNTNDWLQSSGTSYTAILMPYETLHFASNISNSSSTRYTNVSLDTIITLTNSGTVETKDMIYNSAEFVTQIKSGSYNQAFIYINNYTDEIITDLTLNIDFNDYASINFLNSDYWENLSNDNYMYKFALMPGATVLVCKAVNALGSIGAGYYATVTVVTDL